MFLQVDIISSMDVRQTGWNQLQIQHMSTKYTVIKQKKK